MLNDKNNPIRLFCISEHGFNHKESNTPCQDYGLTKEDESNFIFAVADGHGDRNCPRSDIGSRKICEIAVDQMSIFAHDLHAASNLNEAASDSWEVKLLSEPSAEPLVRQLITSIIGNWRDAILEHYENNALTEHERQNAVEYLQRYDLGQRIEHLYGTTLIAGVLTNSYLLLIQQGDGRCTVIDATGNAFQPVPWDEKCFANVTTSICDEDAIARCRYAVLDIRNHPVAACFATTDGIEDSFFSIEELHEYYCDILTGVLEKGADESLTEAEAGLASMSESGSGDDMTLSGFVALDYLENALSVLQSDTRREMLYRKLNRIDSRLESMKAKFDYLTEKLEAARTKQAEAAMVVRNAWATHEEFKQDEAHVLSVSPISLHNVLHPKTLDVIQAAFRTSFAYAEDGLATAQSNLQEASTQFEAIKTEYDEYKSKYDALNDQRTALLNELMEFENESGKLC